MPRTRVLCVDDSPDIANLYSAMIASESDMLSVGTLNSADNLLEFARRENPDVILLDLNMPGKPPLTALTELTDALPSVRTIVFSGYDDAATVEEVMSAGAWGLISKRVEPTEVISCIRRVVQGEMHFPGL